MDALTVLFEPVQVIGYAALLLVLVGYQFYSPRTAIFVHVFSQLVYSLHFYLLGSPVAAVQLIGAGIRDAVAVRAALRWVYVASGVYVLFAWGNALWQGSALIDFIPAVATLFATVTLLFRDRPLQFRLVSLFALCVWLIFYILTGSVAGMLQALLIGGSIALALWRFDKAV
jgi:hypothetical protein